MIAILTVFEGLGKREPRYQTIPPVDVNLKRLTAFSRSYRDQVDRHNRTNRRMLTLDYPDLCDDPQQVMNQVLPVQRTFGVSKFSVDVYTKKSGFTHLSDEGGAEHAQTAPNPMTYFAVGIASSLLTQVERGVQILDLDVDDVKVETKIFFRYTDPFTNNWAGFTDKVVANIVVTSIESPERIQELKQLALKAWAVGEGLANETRIDAATVINGDDWAGQKPRSGKVESPISVDHGFTLTNVTPDLKLQTVEVEADLAMGMNNLPNPMTFTEIGIAESAHDPERPYMHKIRAKSLTENYQTWELYADDSRGYEGIDKAPTSWDYSTVGTSFCLMSQLTGNQRFFQEQGIDIDDYRVEHQFNYQQDSFMTPAMTGHLDDVITRVIVKSDAPEETSMVYANQALRMCFAGEAIQNATEMESGLYLNGSIIK